MNVRERGLLTCEQCRDTNFASRAQAQCDVAGVGKKAAGRLRPAVVLALGVKGQLSVHICPVSVPRRHPRVSTVPGGSTACPQGLIRRWRIGLKLDIRAEACTHRRARYLFHLMLANTGSVYPITVP